MDHISTVVTACRDAAERISAVRADRRHPASDGYMSPIMSSTFSLLADRMSQLGITLLRSKNLPPVAGAPDRIAATFDGTTIAVSPKVSDSVAIFLACHTFGHCQQWVRDHSLRDNDPAEHPEWPDRVAISALSEREANGYGLTLLMEVAPQCVETYLALAHEDWMAFAAYLGDDGTTPMGSIVPNGDLRVATTKVRIAAAFDL